MKVSWEATTGVASPHSPRCQASDTTKQNSSVLFSQGNKIENMLNIKVNLKFLRFRSNTSWSVRRRRSTPPCERNQSSDPVNCLRPTVVFWGMFFFELWNCYQGLEVIDQWPYGVQYKAIPYNIQFNQYHAIWRHLYHGHFCDKSFTIELMLRFLLSLQNYWYCLKLFQQLLLEQPCARSTLDSLGVIESENQTRLLVTGWSRMDELTFCFWLVLCLAWLSSTSTEASGLGDKSLACWSWTQTIVELLLWDALGTWFLGLGT